MAMDNSVPPHKPFLKFLLIGASVLAVINLGLCAYAVHVFDGADYYTSPLGFMIFVCIWTWIVTAAFFLLPRIAPQLYFKWAIVGVLGLTAFFWLTSWSLLAARVAATRFWTISYSSLFGGLFKRSPKGKSSSSSSSNSFSSISDSLSSSLQTSEDIYKKYDTAWKVSAAASGIGALIWVLIVVTLVFYGIACYQYHRSNSTGAGLEGGEKPLPPAAPTEMNNYPPQSTTTPNPDQQFAQQQYQQPDYNQQYQQPPQQYQQQPQHHIPS